MRRLDAFLLPPHQPFGRWGFTPVALVAVSLGWASGCQPPSAEKENAGSPPLAKVTERAPQSAQADSATARRELRRVIARYRTARSYGDRAVVRMTYRVGERVEHESAPLSVHYVAPDRLTMQAYASCLEWRGGTLRAFVEAAEVNRLDRQLLRLSFADPKIEVAKLYHDPVFTHFATAGAGGPAPQIELLFGEKPLAGFFAEETRLELGEEGVVDGRACRRLRIEAEGSTYVLWIDIDHSLIRKIELPPVMLSRAPPEFSSSGDYGKQQPRDEVALSIDFKDAEIDGPYEPILAPLPPANLVPGDTLTLAPPPLASPLLGRQPEPFRLQCRSGHAGKPTFDVTDRGSDREQTILLWVANHAGSELAIEQLAAFADQLPLEVRRENRFVVVQAEKRIGPVGVEGTEAPLGWVNDEAAIGRDRFGIEQAPALCLLGAQGNVHWVQSPVGPEMTATLDGLLRDLRAGIDVGSTLREQYETDLATYRKLLADRRVD